MYIQVLTFHLSDDPTPGALDYCRTASLGLAEFDGFVSVTPVSRVEPGTASTMVVWSNWKAVEGLRHSELYARMQMSPHFESIDDRAFGVDSGYGTVGRLNELLAVA